MPGGFFLEPKPLENLTDGELKAYAQLCKRRIDEGLTQHAYVTGRLEGISVGIRKDGMLTFGGAGLSALGMIGIAVATPAGLIAIAGGALSLLGLDGFGAKARERNLLQIDLRNLNESALFCTSELARISNERKRRLAAQKP
jgi:hypothetical protein